MPAATIDQSQYSSIYCNFCRNNTYHTLRGEYNTTNNCFDEESFVQVNFTTTYSLLQCNACGQGSLQVTEWNSENGQNPPFFYPTRKTAHPPEWIHRLEYRTKVLLTEAYEAINHGMYALAAMGVRAILDTWVSQKTSNENNFSKKLEKLKEEGLLSDQQYEFFQKIFDFGSAAIHRGNIPNQEDTMTALRSLETLLYQDVLKPQVEVLAKNTPPRN